MLRAPSSRTAAVRWLFTGGRLAGPALAGSVLLTGSVLLAGVGLLAGCGTPPGLNDQPSGTVPAVRPPVPSQQATTPALGVPTLAASTPGLTEGSAVECGGNPSAAQVIDLLRHSSGLLPRDVKVSVTRGPLCAGGWQYTVIQEPDREPLQVVSQGRGSTLTLVTAGTDVCSIPVRTGAPVGIRTVACEGTLGL